MEYNTFSRRHKWALNKTVLLQSVLHFNVVKLTVELLMVPTDATEFNFVRSGHALGVRSCKYNHCDT